MLPSGSVLNRSRGIPDEYKRKFKRSAAVLALFLEQSLIGAWAVASYSCAWLADLLDVSFFQSN